jgi:hypothetical protein
MDASFHWGVLSCPVLACPVLFRLVFGDDVKILTSFMGLPILCAAHDRRILRIKKEQFMQFAILLSREFPLEHVHHTQSDRHDSASFDVCSHKSHHLKRLLMERA